MGADAPVSRIARANAGGSTAWHGALYVICGALLFGTIGTARVLGPAAPAVSVSAVRLVLAALLLIGLTSARHGSLSLSPSRVWRLRPVWVAGLAQASFNVTFLSAVTQAGVALGTLVAIGCTPILTGLLARHVTRGWLAATGLAVVGLVALLSRGLGSGASVSGVLFAFGAAASYATFIVASTALGTSDIAIEVKLAAIFAVAAVCLSPALVLSSLAWVGTGSGAAMVVYLALVATVVAYSLFNRGLRTVAPAVAATLGLAEPLVAAGLGVVVLGERLPVVSWLGGAILLAALVVMIRVAGASDPPVERPRIPPCR